MIQKAFGASTILQNGAFTPGAGQGTLASKTVSLPYHRGIILFWTPSVVTSGQTVQLTIVGIDASGNEYNLFQTSAVSANTSQYVYHIYPDANASGTIGTTISQALQMELPVSWYVKETFTDTSGTKAVTRAISYVGVN